MTKINCVKANANIKNINIKPVEKPRYVLLTPNN